jgi:hypothetical protein
MKRIILAVAMACCGCVSLPQNGALKCGFDPAHACPSGFHCASDSTCWRTNQDPSGGGGSGTGGGGAGGGSPDGGSAQPCVFDRASIFGNCTYGP